MKNKIATKKYIKNAKLYSAIALTIGAATITISGCKKSFLEEVPRAQTPDDYFNSNANAAVELVNAIYSKLYDWQQHSFSWIGITSIASDEGEKGSDPGDTGTDKDQMEK